MKIHFVFIIPTFASLLYLTLNSIERFVAIKCTFRYMSIVTGLRLKLTVVINSSWVILCLPDFLQSLS